VRTLPLRLSPIDGESLPGYIARYSHTFKFPPGEVIRSLGLDGGAGGIAAAGSHGTLGQHMHEGWVFADVISRLTALLGACYLAWRSAHGRRPRATPPWSKPHKVA